MSLDHDDMAPSPEQPLNGQGVLGISRLDRFTATTSCNVMEMVPADSHSNNHLPSTSSHGKGDMESPLQFNKLADEIKDKDKSVCMTLVPYNPIRKKQNPIRKKHFKPEISAQLYKQYFGQNRWARFLTLDTDVPIRKFIIENALLTQCRSQDLSLRKLDKNKWMVEATTEIQSETFLKMENIGNVKITVKRHTELNSIHGTAIMPNHEDNDEFDDNVDDDYYKSVILDSLKLRYDNIEDIDIYEIPSRKTPHKKFKIIKIKFEGFTVPNKIKILGESRELREHVPKPLQCQKCSMFGHSASKCRNESVCAFCGSMSHSTKWLCGEAKCRNCGGPHHARTKTCPFYIYNAELKLLQARQGLTIRAAKAELKARNFSNPSTNPEYRRLAREINKTVQVKHVRIPPAVPKTTSTLPGDPIPTSNQFSALSDSDISDDENSIDIMDVSCDTLDSGVKSKPNIDKTNIRKQRHKKSSPDNTVLKKRASESMSPPSVIQVCTNKKQCKNEEQNRITNSAKKPDIDNSCNNDDQSIVKIQECNTSMVPSTLDQTPVQEEVTPSPIIGKQIKSATRLNATDHHGRKCGCDKCFNEEIGKYQDITLTRFYNIMENFIKNKEHNVYGPPQEHPTECMCVDHLIKKRKSKDLHVHEYLYNLQQRKEAISKQSSQDQPVNSSMIRVDYNKVNMKSSVNVHNLPPSP